MEQLTETEQEILTFERLWWKHAGAKDAEIRERFGVSPTRYYQLLEELIERPESCAFDASTVNRLRRLSDLRREQRQAPWPVV